MRRAVALVTCRAARTLDEDLPPLVAAFAAAGVHAAIEDWDDPSVDWARFAAALLRSAWDYAERLPEFLAWVERAAAHTALFNPPPVVRWNCDKHYLRELAEAGLPVVPTRFIECGDDAQHALREFLEGYGGGDLVVKPAIGAGARGTRRHDRAATVETLAHAAELLASARAVMLQPYLDAVDLRGETALMFIDGRFSHAIRKGPLLPRDAPATAGLFAPEEITLRAPDPEELATAERVVAQLPFGTLLYGRVDLIRDREGVPRVLELEITEPSMYFAHAQGSAERFAGATLARLARRAA